MTVYLDAIPAYGAVYTTLKQVREAWNTNKDFGIVTWGPYCNSYTNKSGLEAYGKTYHQGEPVKLQVRYGKFQEKVVIL